MRIAKSLLLVTTPIGLVIGLFEAFRLAGGLAFIMLALILIIGAAMGMLVMTIRHEETERRRAEASREPIGHDTSGDPGLGRDDMEARAPAAHRDDVGIHRD
jgi:hypothetical protein